MKCSLNPDPYKPRPAPANSNLSKDGPPAHNQCLQKCIFINRLGINRYGTRMAGSRICGSWAFTTRCTCEGGQNENFFTYRSLLARVDLFGFGAQWFPQLSSHAWAYRRRGSILWRNLCVALLC